MKCASGHVHDSFAEVNKCDARSASLALLAETRKALAGMGSPKHDHGDGDDKCPVCSKMHEPVGEF